MPPPVRTPQVMEKLESARESSCEFNPPGDPGTPRQGEAVRGLNGVEYRDAVGFPGYRVGTDGSLLSAWTTGRKARIGDVWKVRKLSSGPAGHPSATLYRDRKHVTVLVHALVLEAFRGPCPKGYECCHEDGNPKNNSIDNISWGTRQKNMMDRRRHGVDNRGSRNGRSVLTEGDVYALRFLLDRCNMSQRAAGVIFGITQMGVSDIANGRNWGWLV